MKTPNHLFLSGVTGKFDKDDRKPAMVIVPYSAKETFRELVSSAIFNHPNQIQCVFIGVTTGAKLLCNFADLQRECVELGMDLKEQGLDSLDGWDAQGQWKADDGKVYVPYVLSEPSHEPTVIVWRDRTLSLVWNAIDSDDGTQPIYSDYFIPDDLQD